VYPGDIPESDVHQVHYLVLLIAVAGTTDDEIAGCAPRESDKMHDEVFFGLDVAPPDLANDSTALARLARVFAADGVNIATMAAYIREKFRGDARWASMPCLDVECLRMI
jgi:hypothetical protein